MGPPYPYRYRLRRIHGKKHVIFASDSGKADIRIVLTTAEKERLADLVFHLSTGTPLPDTFYRPSLNRRSDPLLSSRGIMHLHIGDDALVYLIQYRHHVLIICIDNHRLLNMRPPGAGIADHPLLQTERARGLDAVMPDYGEDDD